MQAMTRSRAPHWGYPSMSMRKTCLSRCVQLSGAVGEPVVRVRLYEEVARYDG